MSFPTVRRLMIGLSFLIPALSVDRAAAMPLPIMPLKTQMEAGLLVEAAYRPPHRPVHRPVARPPVHRPVARPPVRPGYRPPVAGVRPPYYRPPVGVRPPYRPPVWTGRPGYYNGWYRPYRWAPGTAIAAGAAIGMIGAAAAASWAPPPPQPGLCWYYTDPSRRQGFWDVCP